jgi:hypothetical protein
MVNAWPRRLLDEDEVDDVRARLIGGRVAKRIALFYKA